MITMQTIKFKMQIEGTNQLCETISNSIYKTIEERKINTMEFQVRDGNLGN